MIRRRGRNSAGLSSDYKLNVTGRLARGSGKTVRRDAQQGRQTRATVRRNNEHHEQYWDDPKDLGHIHHKKKDRERCDTCGGIISEPDGDGVTRHTCLPHDKGKPTQHLSLTRLTFETDCKPCYEFWFDYFTRGHHRDPFNYFIILKAQALPTEHFGQHVFAVEKRERVEF